MTSLPPAVRITPEEYLAADHADEWKNEYIDGEMIVAPHENFRHNLIVGNLIVHLGQQMKGSRCELYALRMRTKICETGAYFFPDAVAVCGEPLCEDRHPDDTSLLNPVLVIEVCSDRTAAMDRGRKAEHYRRASTLREYLLLERDVPRAELWQRCNAHEWTVLAVEGLDGTLTLSSVGCTLALRDVYENALES